MSKSQILVGTALLLAAPTAGAAVTGADAGACLGGKPSMVVRVSGFKKPTGTVKVALYESERYLAKRGKLRAVVVPVRSSEPLDICIAVPAPGQYAVAVHHDVNGNGDKDPSDGGGYSGNPKLSITNLKPSFRRTAVSVGGSPRQVNVVLHYRHGLSIRPVNAG